MKRRKTREGKRKRRAAEAVEATISAAAERLGEGT